jgi:hypothetical protein
MIGSYNKLNINGRQARSSPQWENYYVSKINLFKKLDFMYKDVNYVPYLKTISEGLTKKRSYFNRVKTNPKAK